MIFFAYANDHILHRVWMACGLLGWLSECQQARLVDAPVVRTPAPLTAGVSLQKSRAQRSLP